MIVSAMPTPRSLTVNWVSKGVRVTVTSAAGWALSWRLRKPLEPWLKVLVTRLRVKPAVSSSATLTLSDAPEMLL